MPWSLDARIPVVIVGDAEALAVALASGKPAGVVADRPMGAVPGALTTEVFDASAAGHAAACACCAGRGPAALALDRLFQARVRNACAWFDRVVALAGSAEARDTLTAALREDAVTAARFRAG